ncbi:MAG: transporter substrate-binding domain-containing protein [Myxococcota bacterium]
MIRLRLYIIILIALSFNLWARPERISVIIDNNYPPYSFIDEDGVLKGISIDYWRLWEEKNKVKVNIVGDSWENAQRRMEEGEFDVIDTLFYTEGRSKKYDFSKPYARIDVVIFFESTLSGITDVKSIKGLNVGVKKGDANIDFLKKNGVEYLIEFDNYEDVIRAARDGKIKIFVIDKPPGIYFLFKYKLEDRFRFSEPLYWGEFHRAVKKGNKELISFIESGFESISGEEKGHIEKRWLGYSLSNRLNTRFIKILLLIVSVLALILSITYFWIISLRRMVRERTAELRSEKERAERFASELLETEKRFLNLYRNIPDIIYTMSLNGQFLEMNPSGLAYLGYNESDLKDLRMERLIVEEDLERARKGIEARLSGESGPMVFRVKKKNGEILYIETRGALLYKDGKPYAIQEIGRDITEQKKMEERLLESQKLESLGLLAGGIAHDFNNILMSIVNYIEFIKKDYGNKDLFFQDIKHLKNSADRATRLVQQLLGFSRKQMILPQVMDVNEHITHFVSSISNLLGENIKTELRLSEKKPFIFADRSQFEQILMNLAVNSRDAMPDGGRLIFSTEIVKLSNEIEGNNIYSGDFVVISVKDTGCGIEEHNLKKVFEPFFTTKPVGKGTGLGLSMVYGAMKQNGGFVRIESKVGFGTEVWLYFPLSEKRSEMPLNNVEAHLSDGRFETVLLVEDDNDVRFVIKQILEAHNYNVIEAKNVGEAIKEFELNSDMIRLVITDILMPDNNGIDLKILIQKKYPDTKFLFITGYSEEVLKTKGIELEGTEILYKPFNSEKILRAIDRVLEHKRDPLC